MPAVATAAGLPSRLGKYELLLPLAAGGMARIYIGRSTGIGSFERHVVLKMITPERANDLTAVNMFLDEARLAASLNHQNVAQVFEVGEDAGIHYLAMEYVHGQDLRAMLAKAGSQGTRIPLDLALTVVAGAAAGLHHAHERRTPDGVPLGIVHRDVSPSNIMIGYDGAVKLLDFGIAKATARSVETQSGIIKGKFAYMAPEQCRGRDVDRRSDVFSLGIILYEISTQHRCFRADSDFDTMHRIVTGDVVRPTRLVQGYPQALEAIVMKALAIDAAQRYQSAGMLLEALESFAVSARMSLSTMGLGRFMRDMFGEIQEPWLNTAATKLAPPPHKESTISSTDSSTPAQRSLADDGEVPTPVPEQLIVSESGIPDDQARFPDSSGINAAKTILDLPRNPAERHREQEEAGWSARSYPTPLPVVASPATLPPHRGLQALNPAPEAPLTLDETPPRSAPGIGVGPSPFPGRTTPQAIGIAPRHTPQHSSVPPETAFSTPGSGSGPEIAAPLSGPQPIVSTKHGYASAMQTRDGPYGHPQPGDAMSMPEFQVKPNRKPLYIGIGIVLAGVVAIVFVLLGGMDEESAPAGKSDNLVEPTGSAASAQASAQGSEVEVSDESMVSVIIKSDPPGADVVIAGDKIGTTPFQSKLKRGTKIAPLTVHKEGYADFASKIDLGGEYENSNIKLVPIGETGSGSGSEKGSDSSSPKTGTGGSATTPPPKSGTSPVTTTKTGTVATKPQTATTSTKPAPANTGASTTTRTTTVTKPATTTKTAGEKTSEKPIGEKASEKSAEKAGSEKATSEKKPPVKKEPACQPPGGNLDPFSSIPVCKS